MKRIIWMALGLVFVLLAVSLGSRVSAAQGGPGRYAFATASFGNNNHPVVVVLDSATGEVTPYVIHTGFSLSAGDLRLTQVRVAGK